MMLPQSHKISWPDLYIQAELENESFMDVHIVTARSEFFSILQEMAIISLMENDQSITEYNVNNFVSNELAQARLSVYEQVNITADGIFVVINADTIDDDTTWLALDLVYKAVENGGTWRSDVALTFPISDIINIH